MTCSVSHCLHLNCLSQHTNDSVSGEQFIRSKKDCEKIAAANIKNACSLPVPTGAAAKKGYLEMIKQMMVELEWDDECAQALDNIDRRIRLDFQKDFENAFSAQNIVGVYLHCDGESFKEVVARQSGAPETALRQACGAQVCDVSSLWIVHPVPTTPPASLLRSCLHCNVTLHTNLLVWIRTIRMELGPTKR